MTPDQAELIKDKSREKLEEYLSERGIHIDWNQFAKELLPVKFKNVPGWANALKKIVREQINANLRIHV